jgi:hypothetical protein
MNVVNLLATQISDRDTLGDGKAIFKQVHNVVLGKAGNRQLSYILGGRSDLKAESLTGQGDLKLASNDATTRFAGVFTTQNDLERLPETDVINRLPLESKSIVPFVEKPSVGAPIKEIPPKIIIEGLHSLQRQVDDLEYRSLMRGREYYIIPASKVQELGRNPTIFKERDQPYIKSLYRELWQRGLRLCNR